MADVEMKPADNAATKDLAKKEEPKPVPPPSPAAEIKGNLALIERGVSTLEPRFTNRVLRSLTALRKRLTDAILREAITDVYAKGTP
jgi:26S proteasome regulatory subunit N3